ncbi:MAG: DUF3459 domain-containing protein, partial [Kineosporiaceae bacterium]|nr:DUF3459 domain-containing protein [Aeromicrobium sp.]
NWDEAADAGHCDLLALYRSLAALRRDRADLTDPRMSRISADFDDDARWFALHRGDSTGGGTSIIVNFADFPVALPYGGAVLLAPRDPVAATSTEILLGARAAAILAR